MSVRRSGTAFAVAMLAGCAPGAYETSMVVPITVISDRLETVTAETLEGRGYRRVDREWCAEQRSSERHRWMCFRRTADRRRDEIAVWAEHAHDPANVGSGGPGSDYEIQVRAASYHSVEIARPEGPALREVSWSRTDVPDVMRVDVERLLDALRSLARADRP